MSTPKTLSFTVALALLATTPALADVNTVEVQHADLDLSSTAGRDRLQIRIKYAVKQVCGSPRGFTIRDRLNQRTCENESFERVAPESARTIAAYINKSRRTLSRTAAVANK